MNGKVTVLAHWFFFYAKEQLKHNSKWHVLYYGYVACTVYWIALPVYDGPALLGDVA